MASLSPDSEIHRLAPIDQVIVGLYDNKALFFPTSSLGSSSLVQRLTSALAQTFIVIPALAGTVTYLPDAPQKGTLAVTAPWRTPEDVIKVKDLRKSDYPSYESLRSKHFPMDDIKYHLLMPTRTMYEEITDSRQVDGTPVMLAQINLIKGGIILGIHFHHGFTDGAGSVTIAKVWTAYCRGEDGSHLLSPDIIDRSRLMDGDKGARIEDIRGYFYYPEPKVAAPRHGFLARMFNFFGSLFDLRLKILDALRAVLRLRSSTKIPHSGSETRAKGIFFFPKVKLKELKEMVSKLESDETSWISTNDALVSLIWCCLTAAQKTNTLNDLEPIKDEEAHAVQTTENLSMLAFVIDARRLIKPPLPARFIGNVILWGGIAEPSSTVVPTVKGVTDCAHSLRREIKQHDDTYVSRLIGALKSVPDISRVRLGRMGFDGRSLISNSWAAHDWYDLDWGNQMGRCERVRVDISPIDDFCLIMPELKDREGNRGEAGLEVAIQTKSHHMKMLRENELFNRFAEWRCS